jgi:hypothetical protein
MTAEGVRSLVWDSDELVDWVQGGRRFFRDGKATAGLFGSAESFDAAVVSQSGDYITLMMRIGTKAHLLRRSGELIRELKRDSYYADAYCYPLGFGRMPDGREMLIHCPENYNRLEIEDVLTGERVKSSAERAPMDFFQSRLSVSPGGRWLLSAGWVWHPVDAVHFYDLSQASGDSTALDNGNGSPPGLWEVSSAAFVDDETAMIATTDEFFGDEGDSRDDIPGKNCVALWAIGSLNYSTWIKLSHPPGTIMPIGHNFVVTFYDHPRLYDLRSGSLIDEWQVDSGKQSGSITWSHLPPPIALQPDRARFAVGTSSAIHVVEIDVPRLQS